MAMSLPCITVFVGMRGPPTTETSSAPNAVEMLKEIWRIPNMTMKELLEKIWLTFGDIEDDALFNKLEEDAIVEESLHLTDYGFYAEKANILHNLAGEISRWAHKRMEEIT